MRKDIQPGEVFGRLTAIRKVVRTKPGGPTYWLCRCTCGKELPRISNGLRGGHIKSCGCLNSPEEIGKRSTTHGMTGTPTFKTWQYIHARCYTKSTTLFKNYGGRGIRVCPRWHEFANFLKDMGERPAGLTIERRDVDKDYGPDNCEWATHKTQMDNTRRTIRLTYKGRTQTLLAWAMELGIPRQRLYYRYRKGWPLKDIFQF